MNPNKKVNPLRTKVLLATVSRNEKMQHRASNPGMAKDRGIRAANMYTDLGTIKTNYLEEEFGKLQTDRIIIMDERREHILLCHPQDYEYFERFVQQTVVNPDVVILDPKNEGTVLMVKKLPGANVNAVVRLALAKDDSNRMNSVITFYRMSDSYLGKMLKRRGVSKSRWNKAKEMREPERGSVTQTV